MIRLTVFAFTVFLALVFGSPTQAQPPEPIVVSPPPGITLNLQSAQMIGDQTGALFAATRPNGTIGGVVWMVKDGQTRIVLQPGPADANATGDLTVWPDGRLYYVTVNEARTRIIAYPIMEWVP